MDLCYQQPLGWAPLCLVIAQPLALGTLITLAKGTLPLAPLALAGGTCIGLLLLRLLNEFGKRRSELSAINQPL